MTLWEASEILLGTGGAFLGLGAVCWWGYVLATRVCRSEGARVRLAAATVAACALLIGLFHILAIVSAFRMSVALPVVLALAALTHRLGNGGAAWRQLRADWGEAATSARELWASPARWPFLGAVALVGARGLRGSLAPPLSWDALTYHLFHVGRWVQAGGWVHDVFPDGNRYYGFFPYYGDVFWAWAMLPVRSDLLLAPAGVLVWCALVVAVYSAARSFDAERLPAALVALVLSLLPAIASQITAAYVENTLMVLLMLGLALLARVLRGAPAGLLVLATAAFALAAGVKTNAVPAFGAGLLAGGIALKRRGELSFRTGLVALFLPVLLLAPAPLRAWWETGSPVYPFELKIAGHVLFEANGQFLRLFSGKMIPGDEYGPAGIFYALFFPALDLRLQPFNVGPAGLILVPLGLRGAWRWLRAPETRVGALVLLVLAAATVASAFAPTVRFLWTEWAHMSSRFVIPAFAALALLALAVDGPGVRATWLVLVLVELGLGLPLGWGKVDARAFTAWAPWLLCAGAVAVLGWLLARRGWRGWAAAVLCTCVLGTFVLLERVRQAFRSDYYAAAATHEIFDVMPLGEAVAAAWPLWEVFDAGSYRLAISAGWEGIGQHWFRYPFMGHRLQNEVLYVPLTRGGEVFDHERAEDLAAHADEVAWVTRLVRQQVDAVATLAPAPFEERWLRQRPELFRPVEVKSPTGANHAWWVDRPAAQRWLETQPPREPLPEPRFVENPFSLQPTKGR